MIITLCGKVKFKKDFDRVARELELRGHVVLSIFVWDNIITNKVKGKLDALHKLKMSMSNAIFVIDKDKYIGVSTKEEIRFAKKILNLPVYYMSEGSEYVL